MDVELALAVDRVAGESAPTVVWLTESKRKEEASSVSKTSTASVVRRSIVRARQRCVSTSVRPAGAARPLPPLSGAPVEGELSEPVTASNPRPSQSAWRVGPTTASAARAPSASGCERTCNVERSTVDRRIHQGRRALGSNPVAVSPGSLEHELRHRRDRRCEIDHGGMARHRFRQASPVEDRHPNRLGPCSLSLASLSGDRAITLGLCPAAINAGIA